MVLLQNTDFIIRYRKKFSMSNNHLSDLVITNVISSYRHYGAKGTSGKMSKRSCWGLILKCEGSTRYLCNGREYISDSHHPILLPADSDYTWNCIEEGSYLSVQFDCDCTDNTGLYSFTMADPSSFMKSFLAIEKSPALHPQTAQMLMKRHLYTILADLLESGRGSYCPSDKYNRLRPAVEYMAEHYAESDISNEKLAALCNISTVHFRKTFSCAYHLPPMTYLHRLRIEKACEMLRSDESSISEIAASVGYNSIYHFSKSFKEYMGLSPLNYQRQYFLGKH